MDESHQALDVSCMSFEDAAEVVRRWVKNEQGRSEEIAEKVVATLKRDHLLSLPNRPRYADFYPESNANDARVLWKRTVAFQILHWVERRKGSNEGHFSKEVLEVLEKVIYPDEAKEGLQGGGIARSSHVSQQLDEHPSPSGQKQPNVPSDREFNYPTDLGRPREAFSKLYESRESEFLSGATMQQSPGGHGLAFPSWITPPLSFVILVGSPGYDIMDVKVSSGYVENEDSRSFYVKDGIGFEWLVLETELPNLQGFLKDMQRMAIEVIYQHIDHLRYTNAMTTLQSMKQKLWASFKNTPLALWIEVHLAHVLLRFALMNIENAHTLFEEARQTFNRCLNDMKYGEGWQYLNRLYCSAYIGRAWYHLINGDLNEATQDIERVTRFAWKKSYDCLSATIQVHWARTAVFLAAGDLSNAVKSLDKIGNQVESSRGALNESQRLPLDMHVLRCKGELNSALAVCARCVLSQEPSVQFDRVTREASERVQELCMGVIGDVWFALGACNEAYKYYAMARKSGDLLLRAAALLGQGNVHMRLRKGKDRHHLERAEEDYKESMSIYERLGHAEGKIIVHCNFGTLFMARGQTASSEDQVLVQGLFDQALHHYRRARELALRLKLRPAIVELDCKMGQVHLEKNELRKALSLLEESQELEQPAKPDSLVRAWIEHQLGHCLLKCSENEKGRVKADSLRRAEVHLINTIQHFSSVQLVTRSTEPHYERLWLTMFEEQKETYALLQWCLACQNKPSDAVVWGERGRSRALMRDKWEDVMPVVERSPQIMDGGHDLWMRNLHPNCFDELSCEAAWESLQRWNSLCDLNAGTAIVQYTICRGFGLLIYVLDGSSEPSVYCKSFAELANKISIRSVEDIEHLVVETVDVLLDHSDQKTERESIESERTLLSKLSELLLLPIEDELNKKQPSQNIRQLIIIPHEHLHRVPFPALYCREQTTMLLKKKPRQHLIEKYTLSCVDSIRSLIRCSVLYKRICINGLHLDQNIIKSAELIVGIKDHQSLDLGNLHHAEDEAKRIADICRNRRAKDLIIQLMLGLNATKNLVKQRLAEAQLVHFATHALITTRYEEGGILFAKPPEVQTSGESIRSSLNHAPLEESGGTDNSSSSADGAWRGAHVHECTMRGHDLQKQLADEVFLDADEISAMKLTARLVVLSACETGRGVIAGEGVAGLGRALTRAGVPCTVLSLWPVQDGAAKELMVAFYTRLSEGMSVATALQKAMVQMIHDPSSADPGANRWRVKHWAPFQTFGLPSVRLRTDSSH